MSRYRKTFTEAMQEVSLSEKQITKLKNGVKVLGNALPNKALAQKAADKANKEMGHDADVYQSPFNNRFYVRIKEENISEQEKDHEISMARGELEAISDKALKLSSMLQGKSDEGNPLEAWVQSKITKAKDYINSVADYMEYNPEMNEAFTSQQIKMAYGIANDPRYKGGNYSGAVAAIEKIAKGLSQHPDVLKVLKRVNEELSEMAKDDAYAIGMAAAKKKYNDEPPLDKKTIKKGHEIADKIMKKEFKTLRAEGKMSDIDALQKQGKGAEEIAKLMKLPVKTVKQILGEFTGYVDIRGRMSDKQLDNIKKVWSKKSYKDVTSGIRKMIKDMDPGSKAAIRSKGINVLSKLVDEQKETITEFKKMTVTFKSMADMSKASTDLAKHGFTINAKGMVMKVDGKGADLNKYATDLKNFYGATIKAESATKNSEHPAKEIYESIEAVKNKAKKTGMPYSILKKVYDRGMAAWRGGHRPGATQVQWALARVNSFVTKSSGTWGGADKDLAKQVRGK